MGQADNPQSWIRLATATICVPAQLHDFGFYQPTQPVFEESKWRRLQLADDIANQGCQMLRMGVIRGTP